MNKEQQLQNELDELLLMGTREGERYLACMEFIQEIGLIKEFNEFLKRGETNEQLH